MKLFYSFAALATCQETGTTDVTTNAKAPELCSWCKEDGECQGPDQSNQWMRCGKSGRCVCQNNWADTNGDRIDGCEAFANGATMADDACADEETGPGPG